MAELFYMGGSLFMGTLTLLFLIILGVSIFNAVKIASGNALDDEAMQHNLSYIKSLALFTLITGIFGQLIGLYAAFEAIQEAADISPQMIFGGLKVSTITTLYGVVIFLISYLIWFGLSFFLSTKADSAAS